MLFREAEQSCCRERAVVTGDPAWWPPIVLLAMIDTVETSSPAQTSRASTWLVGIALLLIATALVWYFGLGTVTGDPSGRRVQNPTPPVRVVVAEQGDIEVQLRALGTVTPINTVTVHSRLDGQLVRVLFTEGQHVQAGQLLAELDPRPYQVALAEAQGVEAENVARLNNAKADLDRYESLFAQGLITKQQVASQEALVRQYEGTSASNEAQVNNARLQLSYTRIVAPITGRLGLRQVDAGNLVSSGDPEGIVVITQMRPMSVLFTVPEAEIPAVLEAMRGKRSLSVQAWDRAEAQQLAIGTLQTVDNQIDTATGTIRMRARFENADESLFPNQFVNIRLKVSTVEDATVIPSATVQRASFGTYVYVVQDDGTATIRRITLGPVDGTRVAVTAGVSPGDRVVLEGVDDLSEGTPVEVMSDDAAAAPAAAQDGAKAGEDAPRP